MIQIKKLKILVVQNYMRKLTAKKLNLLVKLVMVAVNRITGDKFGKEARKEKLYPHKHHHQSDVENRVVSDERCTHIVVNVIQLVYAQIQNGKKANQQHKCTECSEKMHRFFAKFCNK